MTNLEFNKSRRLPLVDAFRGLALWAMAGFHFTWDLANFGWIDGDIVLSQPFHWLGHAIASGFLLISGFSLVLAGEARAPLWRSPRYWRRWGEIAAAAGAISAISVTMFPTMPIFFGILHCIALASLVALLFLRAPPVLTLGVGLLALVAPLFFAAPIFDAKIFWWTGLSTFDPASNDYRPILPWLAFVLFGVAVGRLWFGGALLSTRHCERSEAIQTQLAASGLPRRRSPSKDGRPFGSPMAPRNDDGVIRALTFCGRHSLAFYLIHQPVLFGFFSLLSLVAQPAPDERLFTRQCAQQCVNDGAGAEICESSCACVIASSKKDGLWLPLARDRLTPEQKTIVHNEAIACYAAAAGK
jgi:uncharacterized membrane protein